MMEFYPDTKMVLYSTLNEKVLMRSVYKLLYNPLKLASGVRDKVIELPSTRSFDELGWLVG